MFECQIIHKCQVPKQHQQTNFCNQQICHIQELAKPVVCKVRINPEDAMNENRALECNYQKKLVPNKSEFFVCKHLR